MRAVVVHNHYRAAQPSGETRVVVGDIEELESDGVLVESYFRSSDEIANLGLLRRLELAVRPSLSITDAVSFQTLLKSFAPDIVHFHNVYPLLSPSLVRVARRGGAKVVQTVHNYRHSCPRGTWYREGLPCTECVGRSVHFPAVRHRCYGESIAASSSLALATSLHRSTWQSVDLFLPVSHAVNQSLLAIGIPPSRVRVRPNRVSIPEGSTPIEPEGSVLFVGRLEEEKGIRLLVEAWKRSGVREQQTLTIAGGGSLSEWVEAEARASADIRFVGLVPPERVRSLIQASKLVVVPSLWPEPDPLTVVEAMAAGRPVLATHVGSIPDTLGESGGWLVAPSLQGLMSGLAMALSDHVELIRRGHEALDRAISRHEEYVRLSDVYGTVLG